MRLRTEWIGYRQLCMGSCCRQVVSSLNNQGFVDGYYNEMRNGTPGVRSSTLSIVSTQTWILFPHYTPD